MVLTGNNSTLMAQVTEFLSSHFKIKDLSSLNYFLGIQIIRLAAGIFMNQKKYVTDLLQEFTHLSLKSATVPMDQHHELLKDTNSLLLIDVTAYRRLVGELIYLTISRHDLAYFVHVLAQFMNSPHATHWHAALKLVRYLSSTTAQGLSNVAKCNPVLSAFCDADWGSCSRTRLSLTGYCIKLGNTLISWKCKKKQTISRSTTEVL